MWIPQIIRDKYIYFVEIFRYENRLELIYIGKKLTTKSLNKKNQRLFYQFYVIQITISYKTLMCMCQQ